MVVTMAGCEQVYGFPDSAMDGNIGVEFRSATQVRVQSTQNLDSGVGV